MELQAVRTPKEFFRSERDAFYSDWMIAFWREFFQNSVDAGAKNIAISITTEKARGSFDQDEPGEEPVTRIVFDDDGRGMTAEVLRDVYFAIGASTKSGDSSSVGGFGRARLMTCFSQKRYSILTGESFVMGDGPNYVLMGLRDARQQIDTALDKLFNDGAMSTIVGLNDDVELIVDAIRAGGRKGCRVEVDLDHVRSRSWHKLPTEDVMAARLKEYLSESQIAANVTINGKTAEEYFEHDGKLQARRGPVKRWLEVQTDDGLVEFASVHRSEGSKAAHKGKMIVRVDGAAMYTESISAPEVQVILEIKTDMSRTVLNSNRDGIREPYKAVVGELLQELSTDNLSALMDRKAKTKYRIAGDQGLLQSSKAVDLAKIIDAPIEAAELAMLPSAATKTDSRYVTIDDLRDAGLTSDAIETFMNGLRWGDGITGSLLWNYSVPEETKQMLRDFRNEAEHHHDDGVEFFLEKTPEHLKNWVVETIAARIATEKERLRRDEQNARLKDQTDVFINIVSTNDKTKAALARHNPRKWNEETGKGRVLKAQLAAFTSACGYAIEVLREVRPRLADFNWMTGFVLAVPEMIYEGDRARLRAPMAQHLLDEDTGANVYMMNPFREDGSLAYKMSGAQDRRRLITMALHEVAHTVTDSHNEAFALTLTDMIERFHFDEANRRMKHAERAVAAAYGSGRARVQPMDDDPGPRPAERLLSLASGNRPDWDAVNYDDDGTYVVDCETSAHSEYSDDFVAPEGHTQSRRSA